MSRDVNYRVLINVFTLFCSVHKEVKSCTEVMLPYQQEIYLDDTPHRFGRKCFKSVFIGNLS
jgi:hypothetical protein